MEFARAEIWCGQVVGDDAGQARRVARRRAGRVCKAIFHSQGDRSPHFATRVDASRDSEVHQEQVQQVKASKSKRPTAARRPLVTFAESELRNPGPAFRATVRRHGFVGILRDGKLSCFIVSARLWTPKTCENSPGVATITNRGKPEFHIVPVTLWEASLALLENFTGQGLKRTSHLLSFEWKNIPRVNPFLAAFK